MKLMDIDSEHLGIPDSEYQAIVCLFVSDSFSSSATNRFRFHALYDKNNHNFCIRTRIAMFFGSLES